MPANSSPAPSWPCGRIQPRSGAAMRWCTQACRRRRRTRHPLPNPAPEPAPCCRRARATLAPAAFGDAGGAAGDFVPAARSVVASRIICCACLRSASTDSPCAAALGLGGGRLLQVQHEVRDRQIIFVGKLEHGRPFRRREIEHDLVRFDDRALCFFLPVSRRQFTTIELQHGSDFSGHVGMRRMFGIAAEPPEVFAPISGSAVHKPAVRPRGSAALRTAGP